MEHVFITSSVDETLRLGQHIGSNCRGGEVFELVSDLGGGKTAFTRGLVVGVGSDDEVSSPSFTINNSYQGPTLRVEHFDFYRLENPGVMRQALSEDVFLPDTVVAVEWGEGVRDVLPDTKITVSIEAVDEQTRKFTFIYDKSHGYLFEGVSV